MNKKYAFCMVAAMSLAVAACDSDPAPAPAPSPEPVEVIVDEECPRADGEPCK